MGGLLAGCDELVEKPADPPVLRLRAEVPGDYDDKLRGAVFAVTAGLSAAQAKARLEAEGFACEDATCRFSQVVREASWIEWVPAIRPSGPPRSWERVTTVMFLADPVTTPDTIAVGDQPELHDVRLS